MLLVISSYSSEIHSLHEYLFEALVVDVGLSHYLLEQIFVDRRHSLTDCSDARRNGAELGRWELLGLGLKLRWLSKRWGWRRGRRAS